MQRRPARDYYVNALSLAGGPAPLRQRATEALAHLEGPGPVPTELDAWLEAELSRRRDQRKAAALDSLVLRTTGQGDLVIGSPIAGRDRAETEPLIGYFLNTVALRTDLSGAPTFTELFQRVRSASTDAYAHQDVPFERLVEEIATDRSLALSPLFQAVFALQNGLDLAFLWSGAPLPDGMTLAEYAHRGAYPLIATALLAGLFVLVTLRPGAPTRRNPRQY